MADAVVAVAGVSLALIVLGLIFAESRPLAIEFGLVVFLVLVAAGIGVLGYVGWILVRHARRRRQEGDSR